jgi:hypothetical protein
MMWLAGKVEKDLLGPVLQSFELVGEVMCAAYSLQLATPPLLHDRGLTRHRRCMGDELSETSAVLKGCGVP